MGGSGGQGLTCPFLQGLSVFCSTIMECWDQDPEARLTAHCVVEGFNALQGEDQDEDQDPDQDQDQDQRSKAEAHRRKEPETPKEQQESQVATSRTVPA